MNVSEAKSIVNKVKLDPIPKTGEVSILRINTGCELIPGIMTHKVEHVWATRYEFYGYIYSQFGRHFQVDPERDHIEVDVLVHPSEDFDKDCLTWQYVMDTGNFSKYVDAGYYAKCRPWKQLMEQDPSSDTPLRKYTLSEGLIKWQQVTEEEIPTGSIVHSLDQSDLLFISFLDNINDLAPFPKRLLNIRYNFGKTQQLLGFEGK